MHGRAQRINPMSRTVHTTTTIPTTGCSTLPPHAYMKAEWMQWGFAKPKSLSDCMLRTYSSTQFIPSNYFETPTYSILCSPWAPNIPKQWKNISIKIMEKSSCPQFSRCFSAQNDRCTSSSPTDRPVLARAFRGLLGLPHFLHNAMQGLLEGRWSAGWLWWFDG